MDPQIIYCGQLIKIDLMREIIFNILIFVFFRSHMLVISNVSMAKALSVLSFIKCVHQRVRYALITCHKNTRLKHTWQCQKYTKVGVPQLIFTVNNSQ